MSTKEEKFMSVKRLFLFLCALLALGVAACGGDDDGGESVLKEKGTPAQGKEGPVKIAFSTPAADHGWLKAISDNAKAAGDDLGADVELTVNDSAAGSAEQADQIETLIQGKPDVLVILPFEGDALTPVAEKATAAGIPVINVDREFSTPGAYRTWIGGDNYGIGFQAGNYFADELKCKGNVVEIQGVAGISVTELRTEGFTDAIEQRCKGGIKVVARQPADFLPDKGLTVMENILEAEDQIDGVYTHDDDMADGVVAAIENANRQDEMFLTGAGGSNAAMDRIEAGGLYRATFLYNPVMSASAIQLANLIGRGEGLSELAEPEVPSRLQVPATTVTKENVGALKDLGY
jgi:ribose transport system substrate-binding protein